MLHFYVACYRSGGDRVPHYGHLLRILSCGISQNITNALGQMELTSAQGHIIGYLAQRQEPACPRDVEEQFRLSHPTVSGLLSRLEKKGFIEMRPDPNDRRCKRIYLLQKGRDCNGVLFRTIQANEERIVQGFSDEEKRMFADFLTRATRNMGGEVQNIFKEESKQ